MRWPPWFARRYSKLIVLPEKRSLGFQAANGTRSRPVPLPLERRLIDAPRGRGLKAALERRAPSVVELKELQLEVWMSES